ncbi:MAG: TonB-dependent receptor [Gemmatimonadaceae bacterium]|nr:TonB-dependent receptor [Gemmatimonadaceae bacterium]
MFRALSRFVVTLVVTLVVTSAVPLRAQAPTAKDTAQLESVTVRATRTNSTLDRTALAVSRVGRDAWTTARAAGLEDALQMVPGVLALSRSGGTDLRINIRGFGARGAGDRSNAGTTRGVRILLDGIPETEPDGRTSLDGIDLASVESMEIVRSNAGSLWGNAAGGVVSISSVPTFDGRLSEVSVGTGSFGLKRSTLRLGTATGRGKSWLTLTQSDFEGWRPNSAQHRTYLGLGTHAPVGDRTRVGVFGYATRNRMGIPGPLSPAAYTADPRAANATYLARAERRDNRVGRLGSTIEHDLPGGGQLSAMLYVQPKVLQRSERGTFRDFTRYHVGGNTVLHQPTTYGATAGTLTIGVDEAYQDGAILFYSLSANNTRGDTLRQNKREGANNIGAFVVQELRVSDHLGLSVGARYDAITYSSKDFFPGGLSSTKVFSRVTPKLGVTWTRRPGSVWYANLGGGVEAPAGNETDPASTFGQDKVHFINPLLNPIRSTTYEVGSRGAHGTTGLAKALTYDVAGYFAQITDDIVPYRGGRFYFTAGSVHRVGVEATSELTFGDGISAQGTLTLNRHTYAEYLVDSVHYGRAGRTADYAGNRTVGVPDVMYGAQVNWAPTAGHGVRASFGVTAMGEYFADDANKVSVPSATVWRATLATARPITLGGGVGLVGSIAVSNLFDAKYVSSAFLNPDVVANAPQVYEAGLPRQLWFSASLTRTK